MLYPSVSVRPSVRPSVRAHHFRSITWVFIHGIFSNFAYILLSAMSGMELLMGKIRSFLTELLPFFVLEKWFLACYSFTVHDIWMKLHRYVAHQRLHIVTKDRHSDLPQFVSYLPLIGLKKGFWPIVPLLCGISEYNFTDMFHIKGNILWLRTVTLTFPVCELSALDWIKKCFLPVVPLLCGIFK